MSWPTRTPEPVAFGDCGPRWSWPTAAPSRRRKRGCGCWLTGAGLPKPETQIEFRDLHIRVDMGWREWKIAAEYDGIQHWENRYQRSWDIERIALLEAAGWIVIRVSAEMLSRRPHAIVERVIAKLAERGAYGRPTRSFRT